MEKVQIGDATLYCGDCLEILPTLPKVDAVVTDPPYGISYTHSGGGKGSHSGARFGLHHEWANSPISGDDRPFDPSVWCSYPCVLFGADHFARRLPMDGVFHVWDKDPAGKMSHDSFSDAELAWTNFTRSRCVFRYLWKGMCQEGRGEKRRHPTMKPVQVMEWCIGLLKDTPDLILDPFMGSGTTGVACANLGRKFIGIEIERKYFDIACERIEAAYAQGRLFA